MIFKKIKKAHVDWRDFLCGTPANDYIFQKDDYEDQIRNAVNLIKDADTVIIGAGAGASTAAGLEYGGKKFRENFHEFIMKYGGHYMTDMYAAGFYPFPSEEAKWGYWSKHALINRFDPPALPLYKELYDIVKDKEYFVLTTNVDHQFYKAGFAEKRIFATQGDYGKIQCQRGCHPKTYDAKELFQKMDAARKDCLIPSELVPKCPVCGGNMAMNLRCDNYFVEDEAWHEAADRYADFLEQHQSEKVVLIELGVGFNTPIIIRFPFEKMVRENASYSLIRLNKDEAVVPESFGKRAVGIGGDMTHAITDIWRLS
ncbi:Sir2 silent information regulator family NAD-dependent deacetylase [Roseburia sp.]|jgi:NAD-dependent SIR2 family protein deacetylase|uniref:Sir2 silent information regulator family NAD-dependent deacetylase n=1 Tax=Roseburia sp. TaxID=2049040 RepID=UPI00352252A6